MKLDLIYPAVVGELFVQPGKCNGLSKQTTGVVRE